MNPALKYVYTHFLLTSQDLEEIADAHVQVNFTKGSHLLTEGETANEYYILAEGLVRAYVCDRDGNEITTEFFVENDVVIIPASLFQKVPSQENLQAVTDCRLWKIDYDDFQDMFHRLEGLREWGRMWFSYQVFTMKQRSLDMVTQSAAQRYLKLLKEKPLIIRNAPLKYIASYLGITDTSLSRIRKDISI